jgi:hypothetical protein
VAREQGLSLGAAVELVEAYLAQDALWPKSGRHILAQFDADGVVVYQAYRRDIGAFAAEHGHFGGGGFSFERMSWIKPNFLWMMYRCGWGTKPDQETVLAIRLRRDAFDAILAGAVHSTFTREAYPSQDQWRAALRSSDVRLQWDPDHDPHGRPLPRRAIQLGLRGETLRRYSREWIVAIEDITHFVRQQAAHVHKGNLNELSTPRERVYPVGDAEVAARLGLHTSGAPDDRPAP